MYVGILGGTFNPVHIGHLRLALEVLHMRFPHANSAGLDRIDLVPCAHPPHKKQVGILPFPFRCMLLQAAIQDLPRMGINTFEGTREELSYTWDTLQHYKTTQPQTRLLFIMGGTDLATLPQWHRGLELPQLADILVVPRAGVTYDDFCHTIQALWADATLHNTEQPYALLGNGARIIYAPIPQIDISASYIRQCWLATKDIRFLTPDAVYAHLLAAKSFVTTCWKETSNP